MVDFVMMMLSLVFMAVVGSVFLFVIFIVGALISCMIHERIDNKYTDRKH